MPGELCWVVQGGECGGVFEGEQEARVRQWGLFGFLFNYLSLFYHKLPGLRVQLRDKPIVVLNLQFGLLPKHSCSLPDLPF